MTVQYVLSESDCPNCGIEVFQAEALLAGNYRWHKRCFKCCWCDKFLNTGSVNVHQGFLFCKHCLEEVSQNEPPQIYPDTTRIKAGDSFGAREECPRCGGAVFEAEKVVEKGITYHKKCFTCFQCNRPQDDKLQVHIGFDSQVYCKVCYPKIWHTPLPTDPDSTSRIQADGPDDLSGCPRCGGKVFEAEKMLVGQWAYHKQCFVCKACSRPMDYFGCFSHERDIFCRTCFSQIFDERSRSVGPPDTSAIKGNVEQRNACPRCGGVVFEAEKIGARWRDFHRQCLSCHGCGHKLDAGSFFDAPDAEVYCQGCYSVRYGHRTRSRSAGPAVTAIISAPEGDMACCPNCSGRVFEAEKVVSRKRWYHKSCFKCHTCQHLLDQTNFNDGPDGHIYCNTCLKNMDLLDSNLTARSMMETTKIKGDEGNKDTCCRKCGGKVFEAEKMLAKAGVYHKRCFTCQVCNRLLDQLTMMEDGVRLVCKTCYLKESGPTELRVLRPETDGQRAIDTTIIKPADKQSGCVRCGGAVFEAEKITSKGFFFHKRCMSCRSCSKRLDTFSMCAGFGADPEIYCQGCYSRQHGGAGFRGGVQGGQWIDEASSVMSRPTQYIDTAKIKAGQGEESCRKCGGKVFELERIAAKTGVFHKQCLSCHGCKKKLDSTLVYHFEAPDGGVYCKRCFVERFGEGTKPLTYTNTSSISAGEGKGCPRCGGAVFEAERFPVASTKHNYHMQCATCKSCKHKLSTQSLHCGPDSEIYCAGCYSRKFGNIGYRGAQCSSWLDEDATATLRPCQNVDTSKIKASPGDDPRSSCRRCSGKVFDLERVTSKSFVWHRQCFSCKSCGTKLSSTLVSGFEAPDDDIYCRSCFSRIFGDTSTKPAKNSDTGAMKPCSGEHGCPRCRGVVFEAEKVVAAENVWFHKACFNCQVCHTKLDTVRSVIGSNGDAYCQTCYRLQLEEERSRINMAKPQNFIQAPPGDPTACPRCHGKVYEAEKMVSKERMYHKHCFLCVECKHKLDYTNCMEGPNKEIYCKTCYVKEYFTGGRNKFGDARSLPPSSNVKDGCLRCRRQVFEVDRIMSKCGILHKHCLSCADCGRKLEATNFHDSAADIFCAHCYEAAFGVRGRSKSIDPQTTRVSAGPDDAMRCPKCGGKVFEAEKMTTSVGAFHPACMKCAKCGAGLDQSNYHCKNISGSANIFCKGCYTTEFGVLAQNAAAQSEVNTQVIMAEPGELNACPQCLGKVFEAEKMTSNRGRTFHKRCFKCSDCGRALDQGSVCDVPTTGQIFCKNCYGRKYGPVGKSLDPQLASKSLDLSKAKASDPRKACVRCGGGVFALEELISNDRVYHKACAKCKACGKLLEASTLNAGTDKEIYCQGCCSRKFGTAGYRGIQSTNWADEQATVQNRPTSKDTTALIKADSADNACIRCTGKVFDAERVHVAAGVFHTSCFKCADCQTKLDATRVCDAANGEIYCKSCYGKHFGVSGYGYGGFGSNPALVSAAVGGPSRSEYHFTQFF